MTRAPIRPLNWPSHLQAIETGCKIAHETASACWPPDFVPADSTHAAEMIAAADMEFGVLPRLANLVAQGRAADAVTLLRESFAALREIDPALYHVRRCGPNDIRKAVRANSGANAEDCADKYKHSDTGRQLVTAIYRRLYSEGNWKPENTTGQ